MERQEGGEAGVGVLEQRQASNLVQQLRHPCVSGSCRQHAMAGSLCTNGPTCQLMQVRGRALSGWCRPLLI